MNRRSFLRTLSMGSGAAILSGVMAESAVKYFFLNQNPLANIPNRETFLYVYKKMLDARIEIEKILVEDIFLHGSGVPIGCIEFKYCEFITGLSIGTEPLKHDSYGLGVRTDLE